MLAFSSVTGFNIYTQINVSAGTGSEGILLFHKIARYKSKKITRLWERVFPCNKVATVLQIAPIYVVAVRQQHRASGFICLNAGAISSHHIRPIRKVSNAAKTLRFTLSTEHTGRFV